MLDLVLATDMRVHNDFMDRFKQLLEGSQTVDEWVKRTTLCQALIKCADISNPASQFRRCLVDSY